MINFLRGVSLLIAAGLAASLLAMPASAQQRSATINLVISKVGLIVGISGGSGTLRYRGKRYKLSIGGVSFGATIGVSKANLVGSVYNLRRVSDITGTYGAAQAGAAVVKGQKTAELKNNKGVVLKVRGRQKGLEFSLDLGGMRIDLK